MTELDTAEGGAETLSNLAIDQNILGYTLRERIGHGGYGEVWSAEAPGGILKAIKFIYGFHDEERAQREQKALNRIKGLRHPFLLSLERIEVSDGRLVVVTELADMSLKDRFDHYREKGLDGIPRNELLGYLDDAADALDYINQSHSLQHLDVKPENFLIVGGHVKVGDFGLVKEIHEVQQSFMGGLTPSYASPELFDGCPSTTSDQYSLAIVFQELLTGSRPFPGSTAAQLAAQHVQQPPNLDGLSRGDKIVVGRALEKSAANRYKSCKEFISELQNRTISRSDKNAAKASTRSRKRASSTDGTGTDVTDTLKTSLFNHSFVADCCRLDPIECDHDSAELQPTLFISVGSTATSIMRAVRKRLRDRVGGLEDTPAIRFLCIDTDTKELRNACNESPQGSLYFDDILPMPLRTPLEYRDNESLHTTWLSRRWIYNVPRSLQTEGIRPLGRLAFADHHQELFDRLHDLVEGITQPDQLGRTAESVGMTPSDKPKPRVFLVSSISGGVGSGMVIDLAYAVRTVLIEQGHGDVELTGILTYTAGRSASQKNLSMANAFTCLTELFHFDTQKPYPGDPACKLPAFDDGQQTFDSTYIIDMTSEMLPEEYTDTVESVGEYLYLNAITKCSAVFDLCRKQKDNDEISFRTLGLSAAADLSEQDVAYPRSQILKSLTDYWANHDKANVSDIDRLLKNKMHDLQFTLEHLVQSVNEIVQLRFNKNPDVAIASMIADYFQPNRQSTAVRLERIFSLINDAFVGSSNENSRFSKSLEFSLDEHRELRSTELADELCNVILGQLDKAEFRLSGAKTAADRCVAMLNNMSERLQLTQTSAQAELEKVGTELLTPVTESVDNHKSKSIETAIIGFSQLYLQEFVLKEAGKIVLATKHRVESVTRSRLDLVRINLAALPSTVETVEPPTLDATSRDKSSYITALMVNQIAGRLSELVHQVDHGVQGKSLSQLARRDAAEAIEQIFDQISQSISSVICDAMKEIDFEQIIEISELDGNEIAEWLKRHLTLARPELLQLCGGDYHLILAIPERSQSGLIAECLEKHFDEMPTVVPATNGNLTLCYEAEQIPLKSVLLDLIRKRPDCVEYVSRLHTRIDIDWTPATAIVS